MSVIKKQSNVRPTPPYVRWLQIFMGFLIVSLAVYGYVARSAATSLPMIRLVTGLMGGVIIICYYAFRMFRERHQQQDRLVDDGTESRKTRDTNLLSDAFSKRPMGTILVVLLLLAMPIIFRLLPALAHGNPLRAGDWYLILIGEALGALVLFVIWRKPNWFR